MPSRRDLLATVGAVTALGVAGCAGRDCTPADPAGIDWLQPGGDARNTAAAPAQSFPGRVGERWRTSISPDADLLAFAGAAITDGHVITAGRTRDGGFHNSVGLRDGDLGPWHPTPRKIAAPPVLTGDYTVLVHQTETGSELRVFDGGVEVGRYALGDTAATPRAAGTTLFGGDADGAYAYEVTEFEERWRHDFGDEQESGAVPFSPAVDDEAVYLTVTSSSDRGIYALDRQTGEIKWSVEGPRAFREPVRVGSLLLVPVKYELLAFDAETGEGRWSTPTPADRRAFLPPAGAAEGLVVSDGWELHRLDTETGALGWSVEFEGIDRPSVVGETVLVSNGSGTRALELGDGSERWRINDASLVAPLGNGVVVRRAGELIACTACEN